MNNRFTMTAPSPNQRGNSNNAAHPRQNGLIANGNQREYFTPISEVLNKTLTAHIQTIPLVRGLNPNRVQCNKLLPCGHKCQDMNYSETVKHICGMCRDVKELLRDCGHKQLAFCGRACPATKCYKACMRQLECGHSCRKTYCFEPCTELCMDYTCRLAREIVKTHSDPGPAAGENTNVFIDEDWE